jgi:outer membrane lipoprotein SlyB
VAHASIYPLLQIRLAGFAVWVYPDGRSNVTGFCIFNPLNKTMNAPLELSQPTGNNKTLWAAVGVLGLAVLAMGATLIRIQSQPTEPRTVVLPAVTPSATLSAAGAVSALPTAMARTGNAAETVTQSNGMVTPEKTKTSASNRALAQTNNEPLATKIEASETSQNTPTATPKPVQPQTHEPAVARAPAKPVCANCGTVERVTQVERDGAASGVGVVAGGVLGAAVGNQVGGGDGKTLATILGAVGGGMAGNAVEKKMKKVIHYEVIVRMEDGSTRTVQQSTPASVGAQVTVNGNTLSSINR